MKLNIINEPKIISVQFFNHNLKDQVSHLLANDYELITLSNINKYLKGKSVPLYEQSQLQNNNEINNILRKELIPIRRDNDFSYIGNSTLLSFKYFIKELPHNDNIIIVNVIGPAEIKSDKNLYGYSGLNKILINNLNNVTYTYFHFVDWHTNETYNNFLFRFDGEIIKSNNYFNKLENKKKSIVFLNEICNYYGREYENNEIFSLPILIYYFLISLSFLKKNGALFFKYSPIEMESSFQLLYIISTLFESFYFLDNEKDKYIDDQFYSYIKFNNFNNEHINLNKLQKIFKEYYKLDNTLGKNCLYNKNLKDNIIFNFNIKITDTFFNTIHNKNIFLKQKYDFFIKKTEFIKNQLNRNPKSIYKFINNLIEKGLQYAKENNLEINDYYKDYDKNKLDIKLKPKIFPYQKNINYNNLNFTYETTYSITYPKEAEIISQIIKKNSKIKIITDMTANVGGNSINFCKHFEFVNCVEIDKETSIILESNLKEYKYTNFKVFNKSCLDFNEKSDFYFYDPPWGGIFFKMDNSLDLFLGEQNIVDIIKPNFCLKAPLNFNINKLILKFPHIELYKINNILIIINKIYNENYKIIENKTFKKKRFHKKNLKNNNTI